MSPYDKIRSMVKPNASDSFPVMLHRMLTDIDTLAETYPELKEIIGWQSHGRAFKIHDRKRFISVVMNIWFMRIKHSSWVRQLNAYGFRRIQEDGPDQGAFYADNFVRGMPDLAREVHKVKRGKRKAANKEGPAAPAPTGISVSMLPEQPPMHTIPPIFIRTETLVSLPCLGSTRVPDSDIQIQTTTSQQGFVESSESLLDTLLKCHPPPALVSPQTSLDLSSNHQIQTTAAQQGFDESSESLLDTLLKCHPPPALVSPQTSLDLSSNHQIQTTAAQQGFDESSESLLDTLLKCHPPPALVSPQTSLDLSSNHASLDLSADHGSLDLSYDPLMIDLEPLPFESEQTVAEACQLDLISPVQCTSSTNQLPHHLPLSWFEF